MFLPPLFCDSSHVLTLRLAQREGNFAENLRFFACLAATVLMGTDIRRGRTSWRRKWLAALWRLNRPALHPTAIAVADAARLLSAAGGVSVTPEQILGDIDAGLPTNPDGTINLVRYAAWLVKETSAGGD